MQQILEGARQLAAEMAEGDDGESVAEGEELRPITDIDQLILPSEVRQVLIDNGFDAIQNLAGVTFEELAAQTGLSEKDAQTVCAATEAFLRVQKPVAPQ